MVYNSGFLSNFNQTWTLKFKYKNSFNIPIGVCVQSVNQNDNNTETAATTNDINVTTANSQSTNYSAPIVNQNERISSFIWPAVSILYHQNTSLLSLSKRISKNQSVFLESRSKSF